MAKAKPPPPTRPATPPTGFRGVTTGGDVYSVGGVVGAIGPNAKADAADFNFALSDVDLQTLATELSTLRKVMKTQATEAEHDISIGAIAEAEVAAQNGNGVRAVNALKGAGAWAFNLATSIGAKTVTKLLKSILGT